MFSKIDTVRSCAIDPAFANVQNEMLQEMQKNVNDLNYWMIQYSAEIERLQKQGYLE